VSDQHRTDLAEEEAQHAPVTARDRQATIEGRRYHFDGNLADLENEVYIQTMVKQMRQITRIKSDVGLRECVVSDSVGDRVVVKVQKIDDDTKDDFELLRCSYPVPDPRGVQSVIVEIADKGEIGLRARRISICREWSYNNASSSICRSAVQTLFFRLPMTMPLDPSLSREDFP
jgi:hypothetical protein